MKVSKIFGCWEDNITFFLQYFIYTLAYWLPFHPHFIWFTVSGFICWLTAWVLCSCTLYPFILAIVQSAIADLLRPAKVALPALLILFCEHLRKWLFPNLVFIAVANFSPANASYASLSFVIFSGIILAAVNTILAIVFAKKFDRVSVLTACSLALSIVLMAATVAVLNYARISEGWSEVAASLHEMAATVYLEAGQYQNALNQADCSVKLNPQSASAYNARACALQSIDRDREAVADCEKSLAIKPDSYAYVTRGFSLGRLGDLEGQMRDYNSAIALDPKVGVHYLYRAKAYERSGDAALAKSDRNKAKEVGYIFDPLAEGQLKQ